MRVRELRAILDHLPDDAEVHVVSGYAAACHVDTAQWSSFKMSTDKGRYRAGQTTPRAFTLRGSVSWLKDEPPFELYGRFKGAAALEAQLDDLAPVGEFRATNP